MEEPGVLHTVSYTIVLSQIQSQRSAASPDPETKPRIQFELSCDPCYSDWVVPQEDPTEPLLVSAFNGPRIHTHFRLYFSEFMREKDARQIIARELQHWPLSDNHRRRLVEYTIENAMKAVYDIATPLHHSLVYLHIHVRPTRERVLDAALLMDDDVEPRMVPAQDSAIESLESKIIIDDDLCGVCTICMDEISKGCQAIFMPCSHVFHGDCIKNWLRTSHYCPLCRFEMPTGTGN